MKIKSIKIENYKSIKEIEFEITKHGASYTIMLVGINECGKSNILEGMSYLNTPDGDYDYNIIHNQKDEENKPVDLWFTLEFEQEETILNEIRKFLENGKLLDFKIKNIVKNVYLEEGETSFSDDFSFDIEELKEGLFIKKGKKDTTNDKGQAVKVDVISLSDKNDEDESYTALTIEVFGEYFSDNIKEIVKKYVPSVLLWQPSPEYLVSGVDLNEFKDKIESNIPLKHMFHIAGFKDAESIKNEIEKISNDSLRRKLAGRLGKEVTKYIKSIWKHDIIFDIEIAESGACVVSICDGGKANEFNYHKMTARSEGFKQFISLILSLSVETKLSNKRKNSLILIDEPEAHLHPSGIRDLRTELLAIGETNYLFVSTHSPFLVDRKDKERNVIIKKNSSAETEKIEINKSDSMIDDEVLREAFGIEVYKDLLNPHSMIVEGASDKKILQKAFEIKELNNIGITNGHGSNIDTLASKLNDTDISILVVLDDDADGKEYKKKIIKIGGSYTTNNVVTIRDLVGGMINKSTIEDALGASFLQGKVREVFDAKFTPETCTITMNDTEPAIEQIRAFLNREGKSRNTIENFLEEFKTKIANDFNPAKTTFGTRFPHLNSLVDEIKAKLEA